MKDFPQRSLKFPLFYIGILIAGSLDILLTGVILGFGGQEANPLALAVLQSYGMAGLVVFKWVIMGLVILGCDYIALHNYGLARKLTLVMVAIHAAPLPWSTGLIIAVV